jgi:hypothetical protein
MPVSFQNEAAHHKPNSHSNINMRPMMRVRPNRSIQHQSQTSHMVSDFSRAGDKRVKETGGNRNRRKKKRLKKGSGNSRHRKQVSSSPDVGVVHDVLAGLPMEVCYGDPDNPHRKSVILRCGWSGKYVTRNGAIAEATQWVDHGGQISLGIHCYRGNEEDFLDDNDDDKHYAGEDGVPDGSSELGWSVNFHVRRSSLV